MKKLRSHYQVHRLEVLPQVYTCTHTQCRSYLALEVFYTCIKAPSLIICRIAVRMICMHLMYNESAKVWHILDYIALGSTRL